MSRKVLGFVVVTDARPVVQPGERVAYHRDGRVERLADDVAVDVWVCQRVDEPWTWSVKPGQHTAACADCGVSIVYRITDKSPTDPRVPKVCQWCAARRLATDGADA